MSRISELKVLQSAAGYYLGKVYWDREAKAWFPYDRYSGYFPTREAAEQALELHLRADLQEAEGDEEDVPF